MTEIIPKKTLKRIEKDIENNNLGKARDRLHGLIATYPNELALRKSSVIFTLHYNTQKWLDGIGILKKRKQMLCTRHVYNLNTRWETTLIILYVL